MDLSQNIGNVIESVRRFTVLVGSGGGSAGSGVIVGADGSIVTNAHVARSSRLTVETWDGRRFQAMLKARDQNQDLALLSAPISGLTQAILSNSRNLRAGDLVIAVGNPFGFLGAASVGAVHSVGPIPWLGASEWIRTNVKLAPGNSGGPLADAQGQVVGLNTMIIDHLGVAIPSNTVKRFIRPAGSNDMLGIAVRTVNVKIDGESSIGFLILEIIDGSAAEYASLLPGDVLFGTEEKVFRASDDLYEAISGEGERTVRLRFIRGNTRHSRLATVLLGSYRNKAA